MLPTSPPGTQTVFERQKERRHYTEDAINDEEIEGKRMFSVEEKLRCERFCNYFVKEMKGDEFCLRYLQENGFDFPVVIKDKTGLGMRLPSKNFTVNDVRQCVGSRRMLDVMDVTTQKDIEMSMKDWVKYYENPLRDKLLNVISLEFSHTKLENYVEAPAIVRDIDWVDRVWPRHLKLSQTEATNIIEDMKYPKVQKYCLMSVKGCYTDFHIDFGGTSVWYHILHGSKIFWLIPPTEKNLQLYETWVLSGKQGDVFFGDTVEKCNRIQLEEGWTFFIPTGWIHAVFTPTDSLVFGGNFLHSFGIKKQLRIAQIEDTTRVPPKFRYPFYTEILWYVLERYIHCLLGRTHISTPEINNSAIKEDTSEVSSPTKENKDETTPSTPTDSMSTSAGSTSTPTSSQPTSSQPGVTPAIDQNSSTLSDSAPIDANNSNISSPQYASPVASGTAPNISTPTGATIVNPLASCAANALVSCVANSTFGIATTTSPSKLVLSENNVKPEGKIDPTNVEAVRRILDDVARNSQQNSLPQPENPEATTATTVRPQPHLTPYEIDGLKAILLWLSNLPASKKNVPELITDPYALLDDIRLLLELHGNDDPKLAITGKPALTWPDLPQVAKTPIVLKIRPSNKGRPPSSSGSKSKSGSKTSSGARRRRTRCKKCEACLRSDCGECHFCKDMRKFGGPGRMKQSCISRQCMAPVLPHTACCMVCGKDGWEKVEHAEDEVSSLMECSICWEIVHPECLRTRIGSAEGLMNEDLPNSWECPRCCNDGRGGQTKPRPLKGGKHKSSDLARPSLSGANEAGSDSEKTDAEPPLDLAASSTASNSSFTGDQDLVKRRYSDDTSEILLNKKIKVEPNTDITTKPSPFERKFALPLDSPLCLLRRAIDKEKALKMENSVLKVEGDSSVRSFTQYRVGVAEDGSSRVSATNNRDSPDLRPRFTSRVLATQNSNTPIADENKANVSPQKGLSKCEVKVKKCEGDAIGGKRQDGVSPIAGNDSLNSSGLLSGRLQVRNVGTQNNVSRNGKSQLRKPLYVVRPAPIPSDSRDHNNGDVNYALDRDVMISVFPYLSRNDLCRCMRVCKQWNQWCLDSTLWQHIDLTRRQIMAQHLAGLVRRQPRSLVLAWTNISKKLLEWLIARLPQLRHLDLGGCSSSSVMALRTCNCPMLTSLDLKFIEGFHDSMLRELLTPPPDSRPGLIERRTRLRNLARLCLSGCDITDVAVRYLTQHLRLLSHLDLSHCTKITDAGVSLLGAVGSVTRDSLTHINVTGCKKLTDVALDHLRRCPNLVEIDLRSCPDVSAAACKKFITQSKVRLVMIKSKLIEKPPLGLM